MKKALKFLVVLALCGVSSSAFSAMNLGGKYESTDSKAFMDIFVEETGVLKGTRSEFFHVEIKGSATLEQCLMKKEVISHGTLIANTTNFLKDVSASAGKTTLISCHLTNLRILDFNEENPIKVVLEGNTVISGSIIFETGLGHVYKGPEVVILGEVIGGVIINRDN